MTSLTAFFANDPMTVCIVDDEVEFQAAIREASAKGLRIACVSNAGLAHPRRRLTFLPASYFVEGFSC